MNFTDENIPSVYTEGIIVGKKIIKTKPKNMMTYHLY
jgi:hypothetical protein